MSDIVIHLDRQIKTPRNDVSAVFASGTTTWTLPYDVPTDGSAGELVVVAGDGVSGFAFGEEIPSFRTSVDTISTAGTGLDLSSEEVYLGIRYTFSYTLSRLFPRKYQSQNAESRGKLQLRRLIARLYNTGYCKVTVAITDGYTSEYEFSSLTEDDTDFLVSLLANNDHATITFESDHQLGCRIIGIDWEGFWHVRSTMR